MNVSKLKKQAPLHLMLIPAIVITFVYCYLPMLGNIMAFEKFMPNKGFFGSEWVGLDNFEYIFSLPDFGNVLFNTVFIATMKIIGGLAVPIIVSLLLNEMLNSKVKRTVQSMIYLPYFLSWVILGGILIDILSADGIVNRLLGMVGIESIFFLGDNKWFPFTLIITDIWKNFGFNTVIFLAAISGIDPSLYEAAVIDGASRFKCVVHVTLPGMLYIIMLLSLLSLGNLLNAGFDQIFNLYNPIVYKSGDILDTYIYRVGILQARYDLATAMGLFKSVISFVMISVSYYMSYRYADYRVF